MQLESQPHGAHHGGGLGAPAPGPERHAAHRTDASRQLPGSAAQLGRAPGRIRVRLLRRRLPFADHGHRSLSPTSRWSSRWCSTGSPWVSTRSVPPSSCSPTFPRSPNWHLLLSMTTPLGWLERVPSYKEKVTQFPRQQQLRPAGLPGAPGGRHPAAPRRSVPGGRGPGSPHRADPGDRAPIQSSFWPGLP